VPTTHDEVLNTYADMQSVFSYIRGIMRNMSHTEYNFSWDGLLKMLPFRAHSDMEILNAIAHYYKFEGFQTIIDENTKIITFVRIERLPCNECGNTFWKPFLTPTKRNKYYCHGCLVSLDKEIFGLLDSSRECPKAGWLPGEFLPPTLSEIVVEIDQIESDEEEISDWINSQMHTDFLCRNCGNKVANTGNVTQCNSCRASIEANGQLVVVGD
jgi:hypothetical protein